jgi:hypothetical protein
MKGSRTIAVAHVYEVPIIEVGIEARVVAQQTHTAFIAGIELRRIAITKNRSGYESTKAMK